MHSDLYSDDLDSVTNNLRDSAKGSNDGYDVAFSLTGFRRGLAANCIRFDIDPGDASWKTGVLGKTLDTIKQSAIRVARRTPDNVSIQEIFDECTTAHNDIETEDSLRGSCCWERHRPTRQLAKILIWLSAMSEWWTKLRNSVSV